MIKDARKRTRRIADQRDDAVVVHTDGADHGEAAERRLPAGVGGGDDSEAGKAGVEILRTNRNHRAVMGQAALEQIEQGGFVFERAQQFAQAAGIGKFGLFDGLAATFDVELACR